MTKRECWTERNGRPGAPDPLKAYGNTRRKQRNNATTTLPAHHACMYIRSAQGGQSSLSGVTCTMLHSALVLLSCSSAKHQRRLMSCLACCCGQRARPGWSQQMLACCCPITTGICHSAKETRSYGCVDIPPTLEKQETSTTARPKV